MIRRMLAMLAVVLGCAFSGSSVPAPIDHTKDDGGLKAPITQQLTTIAQRCQGSLYAQACREGSSMVYAQTMFAGACSPVGCIVSSDSSPPGPATIFLGDHETALRIAAVEQSEVAGDESLTSSHLQAAAVDFEQGENDSKFVMGKLLKQKPGERDLPALRFTLEEALYTGYIHRNVQRAADVLAWAAHPAGVIAHDQETLLSGDRCRRQSASECPEGSLTLVTRQARGGCAVAACLHVPIEEQGQDRRALFVAAIEEKIPAVLLGQDLKTSQKHLKVMAKTRKEATSLCRDVIKSITRGDQKNGGTIDYAAVRFFVELAHHEGYGGDDIDHARVLLAEHSTLMSRSNQSGTPTAGGAAKVALAATQEREIVREVDSAARSEELEAALGAARKQKRAVEAERNELVAANDELQKQLHIGRQKREALLANLRDVRQEIGVLKSDMDVERRAAEDRLRGALERDHEVPTAGYHQTAVHGDYRPDTSPSGEPSIEADDVDILSIFIGASIAISIFAFYHWRRKEKAQALMEEKLLALRSSNRQGFLRSIRFAVRERLKRVAAESAAATGLASLRDQLDSSVRNARRLDDLVRNVRATQRAAAVQAAQATNMRQQQEAAKAALAEEDAKKAAADAADRRREEQNSWSKERNALRNEVREVRAVQSAAAEKVSRLRERIGSLKTEVESVSDGLRKEQRATAAAEKQWTSERTSMATKIGDLRARLKTEQAAARTTTAAGAATAAGNAADADGPAGKPKEIHADEAATTAGRSAGMVELGGRGTAPAAAAAAGMKSGREHHAKETMVLVEKGELRQRKERAITCVKPWVKRSLKLGVPGDGNCYPASWMLVAVLWSVHEREALASLVTNLEECSKPEGVFTSVPPDLMQYVNEFVEFVVDLSRQWPESEASSHGFELAVRIVKMLAELSSPPAGAQAAAETEDEPRWLKIKWGMALAGRAIDLSWACRLSVPEKDKETLAMISTSVEYDFGRDMMMQESLLSYEGNDKPEASAPMHATDMMRPGGGLGLVIGLCAEYLTGDGSGGVKDTSCDYTDVFCRAAANSGQKHPITQGFRVVKVAHNHYEVLVESGPLAERLAREFDADLSEGDDTGLETMRMQAKCKRDDANPGLEALLGPEGMKEAMEAQLEADRNNRKKEEETKKQKKRSPGAAAATSGKAGNQKSRQKEAKKGSSNRRR